MDINPGKAGRDLIETQTRLSIYNGTDTIKTGLRLGRRGGGNLVDGKGPPRENDCQ